MTADFWHQVWKHCQKGWCNWMQHCTTEMKRVTFLSSWTILLIHLSIYWCNREVISEIAFGSLQSISTERLFLWRWSSGIKQAYRTDFFRVLPVVEEFVVIYNWMLLRLSFSCVSSGKYHVCQDYLLLHSFQSKFYERHLCDSCRHLSINLL